MVANPLLMKALGLGGLEASPFGVPGTDQLLQGSSQDQASQDNTSQVADGIVQQEDPETQARNAIQDALSSMSGMTQQTQMQNMANQSQQPQFAPDSTANDPTLDPVDSSQGAVDNGMDPSNQAAFNWIIQHESGGDVHATNKSSGAFGRGQFLPSNLAEYAKKAGVSNPRTTNPAEQDKMALTYMNERYGSPVKAQDFWKRHGWY